jgi:hypothetical protein
MSKKIYYGKHGQVLGPFSNSLPHEVAAKLELSWIWDESASRWKAVDPEPAKNPNSPASGGSAAVGLLQLAAGLEFGVRMGALHSDGGLLFLDVPEEQQRLRARPERLGQLIFPELKERWVVRLVYEEQAGAWIFTKQGS